MEGRGGDSVELVGGEVEIRSRGAVRVFEGHLHQGRVESAAGESGGQLAKDFALVGHESGDIDECLDVGVPGRCLADHCTAVRMADQDDGALDTPQDAGDVCGVGGQTTQRIGGGDDTVAVGLQASDDPVPTGRVGERAVHQHDGRFAVGSASVGTRGHGRPVGEGRRRRRQSGRGHQCADGRVYSAPPRPRHRGQRHSCSPSEARAGRTSACLACAARAFAAMHMSELPRPFRFSRWIRGSVDG